MKIQMEHTSNGIVTVIRYNILNYNFTGHNYRQFVLMCRIRCVGKEYYLISKQELCERRVLRPGIRARLSAWTTAFLFFFFSNFVNVSP